MLNVAEAQKTIGIVSNQQPGTPWFRKERNRLWRKLWNIAAELDATQTVFDVRAQAYQTAHAKADPSGLIWLKDGGYCREADFAEAISDAAAARLFEEHIPGDEFMFLVEALARFGYDV